MASALSSKERSLMDAYWRAANYLSVGQIYLYDNPLLKQSLTKDHIKPRLLGHWGTTPGLNFIYVHLNRLIKKHDLDMIYITGPGSWRSRSGRERVSRGELQRGLSEHFSR
jgi:xylulose-5-phosphate/fructose-6-phosphate phosphoketolase